MPYLEATIRLHARRASSLSFSKVGTNTLYQTRRPGITLTNSKRVVLSHSMMWVQPLALGRLGMTAADFSTECRVFSLTCVHEMRA